MAKQEGFHNREFSRVPFKRPVKCKTSNVEIYAGHLAQDISQGGMCIKSNEFVPVGSRVIVQVQFDHQGRLLDLEAKVVWTRELPYANGFQLGLEFVEGDLFKKGKIAQFVVKK